MVYRVSLKRQSMALLLGGAVIPLIILGFFSYRKLLDSIDRRELASRAVSVHDKAAQLSGILDRTEELSLEMIADPLVRRLLSAEEPARADGDMQAELSDRLAMQALSVYIRGRNGMVIRSPLSFNTIDQAIIQAVEGPKRPRIWFIEYASPLDHTRRYVSLARRIVDIEHLSRVLGAMKVSAPLPDLGELFPPEGQGATWAILNGAGKTLLSIAPRGEAGSVGAPSPDASIFPAESLVAAADNADSGEFRAPREGGAVIVAFERLSNGWILARASPQGHRGDEGKAALAFLAAAIAIALAIALGFDITLYRRSVAPIVRLGDAMRDLAAPDLGIAIEPSGRDEVARLYDSFNLMSARIRDLMTQVYESGAKQREAEIISLRARIDPHFLYNTLDSIYWMCRMEGASVSADMVRDLSSIFRYNLDPSDSFAPLRAEIRFLQAYFALVGRRYEERIAFTLDCPAEIQEARILRFALQPLVENALVHGLGPAGGKGCVIFRARVEDRDLTCVVEDDGVGADPHEMAALLAAGQGAGTRGFAIRNVHDRIRLLFGEGYGLSFTRREGGGTRVTLKLPWEEYRDA